MTKSNVNIFEAKLQKVAIDFINEKIVWRQKFCTLINIF